MAELLVVIVVLAFLCIFYLPQYPQVDFKDYRFMNDYLYTQSVAMSSKERTEMENDTIAPFPIYFSKTGNVNQAQTITGELFQIIIHLGNGYLTYEN